MLIILELPGKSYKIKTLRTIPKFAVVVDRKVERKIIVFSKMLWIKIEKLGNSKNCVIFRSSDVFEDLTFIIL